MEDVDGLPPGVELKPIQRTRCDLYINIQNVGTGRPALQHVSAIGYDNIYVGKLSAMGQPTRPTQPEIPPGSVNG